VGCTLLGEPSSSDIEDAQAEVAQIQEDLFVPDGASLITSTVTYATNPRVYPGCVIGMYYASYETYRGFNEVLDEYRDVLVSTRWQLSPDHEHGLSGFEALVSGPQVILTIASDPLIPDLVPLATPLKDPAATVYYIGLRYYDPSRRECSEG
jgi:hypothetical protein